VGDLRKLLLSSILIENLERKYKLHPRAALDLIKMIHSLFNHRLPEEESSFKCVAKSAARSPFQICGVSARKLWPMLSASLERISRPEDRADYFSRRTRAGNLLLTSRAFLRPARGKKNRPPVEGIQAALTHRRSHWGATGASTPRPTHPAS